jgi:hypothetical protein
VAEAALLAEGRLPGRAQSGSSWREELEASLTAVVDAAFEPSGITPSDRAVVRAMVDLGTWQALRDRVSGLRRPSTP